MTRTTGCVAAVLFAALAGYAASALAQPDGYRAGSQPTITCSSNSNHRQTCRVGRWSDARLVRQISDTRCVRGRNWGFQRDRIWVDDGCRATFAEVRGRRGNRRRGETITCSSNSNRRATCRVRGWRDATLVRQISNTRCVRGRNWGLQRGALWVDNGCRGSFAEVGDSRYGHDQYGNGQYTDGRYPHGTPWQPGPGWNRQIRLSCASNSQRYQMCRVDIGRRGSVRLQRQDSHAACVFNRSWGFNRAGVWVNNGCRGHFVVNRRW